MYKPGGTIAAALNRIQQTNYVLPAIQREFVPQSLFRAYRLCVVEETKVVYGTVLVRFGRSKQV